jgi:hypothetical protein
MCLCQCYHFGGIEFDAVYFCYILIFLMFILAFSGAMSGSTVQDSETFF